MKVLQSTQRSFWHLGVDPQQALQSHPFNRRSVMAIVVLSLSTISCLINLLYVANTFIEYTLSIYAFTSMLVSTAIVLMVVFSMGPLLDCFNAIEKIINERT